MVAMFFFIIAIRDPSSLWVNHLIVLNLVLFLPPRLLSLGLWLLRALSTIMHEQINPTKADNFPAPASMQLPMTLVIMPCYRESLTAVLASVNSVAQSIYPQDRIHIFLSFDGSQNLDTFTQLVNTVRAKEKASRPFLCAEVALGNGLLTICLFEHCGKAHCQGKTVDYIKQYHHEYFQEPSDASILYLDSDTIICRSALRLFATRLVNTNVQLLG